MGAGPLFSEHSWPDRDETPLILAVRLPAGDESGPPSRTHFAHLEIDALTGTKMMRSSIVPDACMSMKPFLSLN